MVAKLDFRCDARPTFPVIFAVCIATFFRNALLNFAFSFTNAAFFSFNITRLAKSPYLVRWNTRSGRSSSFHTPAERSRNRLTCRVAGGEELNTSPFCRTTTTTKQTSRQMYRYGREGRARTVAETTKRRNRAGSPLPARGSTDAAGAEA